MLDAPGIIIGQYSGGSSTTDVKALAQSMIDNRSLTNLAWFSLSPRPLDRHHPWLQHAPVDRKINNEPVDNGQYIELDLDGMAVRPEDGLASMMAMPDPPANSCTVEYLHGRCVVLILRRGVKMTLPADFKDTFRQCRVLIIGQYDGTTMSRDEMLREFFVKKSMEHFTIFRL